MILKDVGVFLANIATVLLGLLVPASVLVMVYAAKALKRYETIIANTRVEDEAKLKNLVSQPERGYESLTKQVKKEIRQATRRLARIKFARFLRTPGVFVLGTVLLLVVALTAAILAAAVVEPDHPRLLLALTNLGISAIAVTLMWTSALLVLTYREVRKEVRLGPSILISIADDAPLTSAVVDEWCDVIVDVRNVGDEIAQSVLVTVAGTTNIEIEGATKANEQLIGRRVLPVQLHVDLGRIYEDTSRYSKIRFRVLVLAEETYLGVYVQGKNFKRQRIGWSIKPKQPT